MGVEVVRAQVKGVEKLMSSGFVPESIGLLFDKETPMKRGDIIIGVQECQKEYCLPELADSSVVIVYSGGCKIQTGT